MGWLIGLAIVAVILFLPLGFSAIYRQDEPGVWLLIGPLRLKVFPGSKKKAKPKQSKKAKKQVSKSKKKDKTKGGSYKDFLPVVQTIIAFLGEFRRKIRVRRLDLKVVLAGGDPSELAVNYGKAWAALGNLMPQLERLFVIKKRNVEVECDFTADQTLIYGRLDATITVGRTLHLLSRHGFKILKQLLELKKLRKGGAQL